MRYLRTKSGVGLMVMLVLLASVALLRADPGDLDLTFGGGDGYVTTDIHQLDSPSATVIDSQGRIIVVGRSNDQTNPGDAQCLILRYTSEGILDVSFGNAGVVEFDFDTNFCTLFHVVLDASERIVVTGGFLARFNSNGSLDTTFGNEGVVSDPTGGFIASYIGTDGKIIVLKSQVEMMSVARYNEDGTLDTSFGENGVTATVANSETRSLIATNDGGSVLLGSIHGDSDLNIVLAKYTSTGVLDQNFGNSGIVITDIGETEVVYQGILDSQGRILVAGTDAELFNGVTQIAHSLILRYLPDGTLDNTFGDNGLVLTEIYDMSVIYSLAIDAANRIVTAGIYIDIYNPYQVYSSFVARYTPDGELDTTFGDEAGFSLFVRPILVSLDTVNLDNMGRIVLVGGLIDYQDSDLLVVRYQGGDAPPTATLTPTNTLTPTQTATDSPTLAATATDSTAEPTATSTLDGSLDLLVDGGFEAEITGWQVKNLTLDKVKCDKPEKPVAYEGECAFRFKGSVGENSQVFQKLDLNGENFAAGDSFTLQAYIHAKGQVDLKTQAKFTYADDTKEKIAINLNATTDDYTVFSDGYTLKDAGMVKVKVTLKNKSVSGKIDVDAVSLSYVAAESGLLPLP